MQMSQLGNTQEETGVISEAEQRERLLSSSDTENGEISKGLPPPAAMANPISSETRNSVYIALNICSSIGIVMTNKWVFEREQFKFGTLLTVIHFLATFFGLVLCAKKGVFKPKKIELKAVLPLCLSFCGFVVLTNLSLQYNSVGFYQVRCFTSEKDIKSSRDTIQNQTAKVMTTPVIMVIQTIWYNKTFSTLIQASLFVTCVGVMITSATDVQINFIGTMYAIAGVLVTSLYQIWVQTGQKDLGVDSMQLLYYQAPISAVMLLFVTPFIDDMGKLMEYDWTASAVTGILVSAVLAFFVNLSTFLIIGKTSPVYVVFFVCKSSFSANTLPNTARTMSLAISNSVSLFSLVSSSSSTQLMPGISLESLSLLLECSLIATSSCTCPRQLVFRGTLIII